MGSERGAWGLKGGGLKGGMGSEGGLKGGMGSEGGAERGHGGLKRGGGILGLQTIPTLLTFS